MKSVIALLLFFSVAIVGKTQSTSLPIDSALGIFKGNYPQEKVFVQTDKDVYIAGETIWMKAWCSLEEAPSFLSKIVYIDLVDELGKVVAKKMYLMDSLSSSGADFELPESVETGTFAINAYTLWMLNFPEYIFKKNVLIYGRDYNSKTAALKNKRSSVTIRLFPEGGDIISGVNNRIAFKATDNNGFPASVKGQVTDKNGKKVAEIVTEHDGMGTFELTAEENNEYTAVISSPSEPKNSATVKLPKAKEEGIAIKIENSNPNRLFVLMNRAEKGKEKFSKVNVVATINYTVIFSKTLDLEKGENAVAISKKNLPAGILHVTLFNQNNLPIAERIAFVENYQFIKPSIAVEHKDLKAKAKNQVSFTIDSVASPSLSCLITSYRPGDSVSRFNENIASAFLITSDLKGYIHQPGFYFKDKSALTLRSLDLLMMTQGWRRYEWNKIQRNEFAALKYPVQTAMSFRGSVYKSDSKDIITDGKVSFIIKGIDSTSILAEAKITDKGEFLLNNINYIKKAAVAYMGTNAKRENFIVDVKLLPNYIDSLKSSGNKPFITLDTANNRPQNTALSSYLNEALNSYEADLRSKTLEAVVIKTKKKSPEDSLNLAYAGGAFLMGKTIDPATFKNYQTIWQMIQAAVPGVTVEGNPFDPVVSFNRFAAFGGNGTNTAEGTTDEMSESGVMETGGVAYFLNEVNVSKDVINTLTVDDIALIKVLKNEAAALGATQGAIAVYTKQGASLGGSIYDKRYTTQTLEGYAISKEFYQPDYTFNPSLQEKDNRYTLYWNSKLTPAKDGRYRFQFYNNSIGKQARLLIQGMDKFGQLIYKELIIE